MLMKEKVSVNLNTVYCLSENLVTKEVQGELFVIPLSAGVADLENKFFKINQTARAIWDKLDGKKTLKEIADELSLEYDAPLELIQKELLEVAADLLERGMLVAE